MNHRFFLKAFRFFVKRKMKEKASPLQDLDVDAESRTQCCCFMWAEGTGVESSCLLVAVGYQSPQVPNLPDRYQDRSSALPRVQVFDSSLHIIRNFGERPCHPSADSVSLYILIEAVEYRLLQATSTVRLRV
jgi:hypothetical protein